VLQVPPSPAFGTPPGGPPGGSAVALHSSRSLSSGEPSPKAQPLRTRCRRLRKWEQGRRGPEGRARPPADRRSAPSDAQGKPGGFRSESRSEEPVARGTRHHEPRVVGAGVPGSLDRVSGRGSRSSGHRANCVRLSSPLRVVSRPVNPRGPGRTVPEWYGTRRPLSCRYLLTGKPKRRIELGIGPDQDQPESSYALRARAAPRRSGGIS